MEKLCELSSIKESKIYLPTYYIYKCSMKDNMNDCELPIRLLAIDSYYNKNNFGLQMYDEIQRYRVSHNKNIPIEQLDNLKNFTDLITSIKQNGFLEEYPIILNKDFAVVDGAHRLAIAIYFGIKQVPVIFPENAYNFDFDYSLHWLKNNGFEKYCELIENKHLETLKQFENESENSNVL